MKDDMKNHIAIIVDIIVVFDIIGHWQITEQLLSTFIA